MAKLVDLSSKNEVGTKVGEVKKVFQPVPTKVGEVGTRVGTIPTDIVPEK